MDVSLKDQVESSGRKSQFASPELCPNIKRGELWGPQQRDDGSGPKVS